MLAIARIQKWVAYSLTSILSLLEFIFLFIILFSSFLEAVSDFIFYTFIGVNIVFISSLHSSGEHRLHILPTFIRETSSSYPRYIHPGETSSSYPRYIHPGETSPSYARYRSLRNFNTTLRLFLVLHSFFHFSITSNICFIVFRVVLVSFPLSRFTFDPSSPFLFSFPLFTQSFHAIMMIIPFPTF